MNGVAGVSHDFSPANTDARLRTVGEDEFAPARDTRVPGRIVETEPYTSAEAKRSTLIYSGGPAWQLQTVICVGERRYQLAGIFAIDLEYDVDGVFASHKRLPVSGFGETLDKALEAFCEAFDYQYRGLVEDDESSLTEDAKRHRQALKAVVVGVK